MSDELNTGVNAPATDAVQTEGSRGTESELKAAPSPAQDAEKPRDSEISGLQKRFDELTYLRREAERREAAKDRQNEQLLNLLNQQRAAASQVQQQQPRTLADFGHDEGKFREYLREEAATEARKVAQETARTFRDETDKARRREKFETKLDEFRKTAKDFDQVFTADTPISEAMGEAIQESDEAGALAYYLGKNPEVARSLYRLSPVQAGRELARIEDRLVAERKKAAEKTVSDAPPPTPKIEGVAADTGSAKTTDPTGDKLSDDEWVKAERKRLAGKKLSAKR